MRDGLADVWNPFDAAAARALFQVHSDAGNTSAAQSLTFTYLRTHAVTFGATGIPTGGSSDTGTNQVLTVTVGSGTPATYTAAQLPVTVSAVEGSTVSYAYGNPVASTSSDGGLYILQNPGALPASPLTVPPIVCVSVVQVTWIDDTLAAPTVPLPPATEQVCEGAVG